MYHSFYVMINSINNNEKKEIIMSGKTRIEKDFLGPVNVPINAYYGGQTVRAVENFQISNLKLSDLPLLIKSLAMIKKAAAYTNEELGLLDSNITKEIAWACDEIIAKRHNDQFPVDMYQGGAGTSVNMNMNEVIANLALEHMGKKRGDYSHCHPNNHVNLSQSTNDAFPSALHLALYYRMNPLLIVIEQLLKSLEERANAWRDIVKMGRTQLQDAVPMTFGQEFGAFANSIRKDKNNLIRVQESLLELNMGGTAIGTGILTHRDYPLIYLKHIQEVSGLPVRIVDDLIEASWNTSDFVRVSSGIKQLAIKLSKVAKDLRLLSSGPMCGFNEINLPQLQPGSSIMPGKVNPVIPELINQISFRVISNDFITTMAAESGQLQLNVMEPVIALSLFESIDLLTRGIDTLDKKCIRGITINEEVCKHHVEHSVAIVTALNPVLGYEVGSALVKEAQKTKKSIYDLVLQHGYLKEEALKKLLDPKNMTRPNIE